MEVETISACDLLFILLTVKVEISAGNNVCTSADQDDR